MNKKEKMILIHCREKLYNLYWYGGDIRIMGDVCFIIDSLLSGVGTDKNSGLGIVKR